ncbi:uncharacterized protein LOC117587835 [Drosophila guanche]|uniref:Uncharacterized protein n=1 Tax=Drosophila guanche TaxID=7266 RepID=A0A3B0JVX6_DROGU|nr:uncharacterized protein LOC117587835 [Drosophila guanche]SPP86235.1 Hypothetical predicted protein [Drosophila guanche]
MFNKRKFSSLWASFRNEQQENASADARPSAAKQQCQAKSPLVESLQRKSTPSKFDCAWQKLQHSMETSSSPRPSHWDTRQSTCSQLLDISQETPRKFKGLAVGLTNSSTRPAIAQGANETPTKLSSSRKIAELWSELSGHSLNDSSLIDSSDDSYIDASPVTQLVRGQTQPVTQLVPTQTQSQYLPLSCKKASTPYRMPRCVKGGYVEEFRTTMKRVRMDQRHLRNTKASHTVYVLDVSTEFGVHLAQVEPAPGTNCVDSSFHILLHSDIAAAVRVGSRLELYLDSNKKPLQLRDKRRVYSQPHNIVIL